MVIHGCSIVDDDDPSHDNIDSDGGVGECMCVCYDDNVCAHVGLPANTNGFNMKY